MNKLINKINSYKKLSNEEYIEYFSDEIKWDENIEYFSDYIIEKYLHKFNVQNLIENRILKNSSIEKILYNVKIVDLITHQLLTMEEIKEMYRKKMNIKDIKKRSLTNSLKENITKKRKYISDDIYDDLIEINEDKLCKSVIIKLSPQKLLLNELKEKISKGIINIK
jgi:hypothetical protein